MALHQQKETETSTRPRWSDKSGSDFYQPKNSSFKIVSGSYWSDIKIRIPGPSGTMNDEIWQEHPAIAEMRACGAIFVNDVFISLWGITTGLMFLDGGYGSSKTTYVITRLLVKCIENKYFRCFYGRLKKTEARNLHSNIITEIKRNGWEDLFEYSEKPTGSPRIVCKENGHYFDMFGCDDDDSLKGIDNPTDILVDEINQISFESFGMLFTRLRGQGYETQMIGCFNNCDVFPDHWIRRFIYSSEKASNDEEKVLLDALLGVNITKHHSDYLDNYFQNPVKYRNALVVKAGGNLDKIKAYCNGEWGVLLDAQPYYKMFNQKHHTRDDYDIEGYMGYNPNLPLFISFDENVNPYLPCIICQISGYSLYAIDEIAAVNPFNTLRWVCEEIKRRFPRHTAGMYIFGDATSKKNDVKQEKGANFFSLVMEYLDRYNPNLCVPDSNPNNAMRGNFMNAILGLNYEEISINIFKKCKTLIEDLQNCPEDPKGKGKLKQTAMINGVRGVQKYGHFGDCLDYLVCQHFMYQYMLFQNGGYTYDCTGGPRTVKNTIDRVNNKVYTPDFEDEDDDYEDESLTYGKRVSRNGYR